MARQKNEQVKQAILREAEVLLKERGYNATTINAIARAAGISPSNVYIYFGSKIEIAFAVFEPWMRKNMRELQQKVWDEVDPDARLDLLINGLLRDIAGDRSGQTLTLVQALSMARPEDNYDPSLLTWSMDQIRDLIGFALPHTNRIERDQITLVLMLSFDGIALRQNLRRGEISDENSVEAIKTLLTKFCRAKALSGC